MRRPFLAPGLALFLFATSSFAGPRETLVFSGGGSRFVAGKNAAALAPLTTNVERSAAARAHLDAFVADAHNLTLRAGAVDNFGDGESVVHFGQLHRGVPVVGSDAVVRVAKDGSARVVVDSLVRNLPSSTVPLVTADRASDVAARYSPVKVGASDARLVVLALHGEARLAWVFVPAVPMSLPVRPRIIVDARTGELLEVRDLAQYAAQAQTYEANPKKTPTLALRDFGIAPTGTTLDNPFVRTINCIDKKSVKDVDFGIPLKVHVCDAVQTAVANAEGNFVYTPVDTGPEAAEDPFSEVSMYYHVNRAYAFFRDLQGDAEAQVVNDKPLPAMANLRVPSGFAGGDFSKLSDPNTPLTPFSNAFFSPAQGGMGGVFADIFDIPGGAMLFGQGPRRDYAYDGDVVYHEFGHAVVDRTLKLGGWALDEFGATAAPGSMNEGLADYFSSAITGDPDVGEYASEDIDQNSSVIRTIANKDACPTMVVGEVHADSTLFSGALWEARDKLPATDRKAFDVALYKAMRTSPGKPDLTYDALAKMFIAQLKTDMPAAAPVLEAAMTGRGVLPKCTRVLEVTDKAANAPKYGSRSPGFTAPGKQNFGSPLAAGIVQVTKKVPAGATKVKVTATLAAAQTSTNPLGGNGKPFTPALLLRWNEPIAWALGRTGKVTTDDQRDVAAGTTFTEEFDVPEGTTAVFVQIANKGDTDGAYDTVSIETVGGETVTPTPVTPTTPAAATTSTGCSCNSGSARDVTGGAVPCAAGVGIALLMMRRRRRSA